MCSRRLVFLASIVSTLSAVPARGEDPPPFAFEWYLDFPPGTISIEPAGNLWFLDPTTYYLHRARRDGNPLDAGGGACDLSCTPNGGAFAVAGNSIRLVHADGLWECESPVYAPWGIAADGNGEAYMLHAYLNPYLPTVTRVSAECGFMEMFDPGFPPGDIAVGSDGTLFLTDTDQNRIVHLDTAGAELGSWSLGSGEIPNILASHPDGTLLVGAAHTVFKYDASGILVASWGDEVTFGAISGVAVNALGDVYVCDSQKRRIRMYGVRQSGDNPPPPPLPPPPPPPLPPPLTSHPAAILLHVVPLTGHAACDGLSSLDSVITVQSTSPDDSHHSIVYMIATPDRITYQICGVQAGIAYDATRNGHPGLEVLSWHVCADLEFKGDDWPASGSGNTMTWADNYSTDINVVGYFEVIAHGPATMSVIPWPITGMAKIANCGAIEYALEVPPDRLGWVSWGGAGFGLDTNGCNPVLEPCVGGTVATQPSTWGRLKNLYRH